MCACQLALAIIQELRVLQKATPLLSLHSSTGVADLRPQFLPSSPSCLLQHNRHYRQSATMKGRKAFCQPLGFGPEISAKNMIMHGVLSSTNMSTPPTPLAP